MLTKKTSKKKSVAVECERVVFEQHYLTICQAWNGNYSFEIPNKLYTTDMVEAVAYLMKMPQFSKASFWNMPVNTDAEISTVKALYWLSGGDDFWQSPLYNADWIRSFPVLLRRFDAPINRIYEGKTLGDIRANIEASLNLDVFFEFALQQNII